MRLNAKAVADALALANRGTPCFPCRADKTPATPCGFKSAVCDPGAVADLWRRHPGPLVGVPTGEASGFDVLDIDPRHGGDRWLEAERTRIPITREHRTGSGGCHILFRHRDGIRNSASRIAPGVDVRGDGGYVIWWPTTGLPVLSDAPIAQWPCWLLTECRPRPRPFSPIARVPDHHFLSALARTVAAAPEGERNGRTFWAACRASEMVASGLLCVDTAVAVITEAATRAGLPRSEAERTVRSGIRTGGVHPDG
jgi:Bifunctional DNA primase/polymerase, N-terminal